MKRSKGLDSGKGETTELVVSSGDFDLAGYYEGVVSRDELVKSREALLEIDGHSSLLVRAQVYRHNLQWWGEWEKMMASEDFEERRCAMVEYNKLQARVAERHTDKDGGGGGNVVVKITNYQGEKETVVDLENENTVEAEVVEA